MAGLFVYISFNVEVRDFDERANFLLDSSDDVFLVCVPQ
jgi:hypothetical protein